jgi:hypothetical protein
LWKTTSGIELLEVSDKVNAKDADEFGAKLAAFMLAIPGVTQLIGSKTEFALKNSNYRPLPIAPQV